VRRPIRSNEAATNRASASTESRGRVLFYCQSWEQNAVSGRRIRRQRTGQASATVRATERARGKRERVSERKGGESERARDSAERERERERERQQEQLFPWQGFESML